MQARRAISQERRQSLQDLHDLFAGLCVKLESRLVKEEVFCTEIAFVSTYENGRSWSDSIHVSPPLQDAMLIRKKLLTRMDEFSKHHNSGPIINNNITSMGVSISRFIPSDMIQLHLFEDNVQKDKLRKVIYNVKDKYGSDKIMRAIELRDEQVLKDAIGFGSVKDLHSDLF